MEKQIEEMAKDLQETHDYDGCEAWHCGGCEYEKYGKNYFCSSIKQAEKMTAKGYHRQEWISVDERLPTEQKEYLAYYGFDNGDGDLGMMFTGVLTYFAYDKKPHFQHEDLRLRVTHWMPLPEPPKMKGGAE